MTGVNRSLARECAGMVWSKGKARPVILELEPPGHVINFRLKGERTRHSLPIEYLYKLAVRATVEDIKRAKREEKKKRMKEI